jgi:aminoglycoside phosphotransferase (APT) family kinase protein
VALQNALHSACLGAGLDPAGAALLRKSVNAVFTLESKPVVVRLRDAGSVDEVRRTVATARWLADRQAPTVRLYGDIPQPLVVDEYVATFWEAVPLSKRRTVGGDLGVPLRRLHEVEPAPDLPRWDMVTRIRCHISQALEVSVADRDWLTEQCDQLEAACDDVLPNLRHGIMHGDAKIGNVLVAQSGDLVLCDLDSLAYGPVIYDLVPTAVDAIRQRRPVRHATLAYAYGLDVIREPAWPVLRRLREIEQTVSRLAKDTVRPEVLEEARYRLQTLRDGDDGARWRRYSNV